MQRICDKLKSKAGTSLILALVFMLICAFVGAAVLASSTANVGRTENLFKDNQDYLSQRSAANLILDELFEEDVNGNGDLVLKCSYTGTVIRTVRRIEDKSETIIKQETSDVSQVVFEAGGNNATATMNQLQRVVYETAVMNYIEVNGLPQGINPTFKNFKYVDGSTAQTTDNFIVSDSASTLFLSDPADPDGSAGITARVRFSETNPNNLVIDFGEDSKVSILINARSFANPKINGEESKTELGDNLYEVRIPTTDSTSLTWSRTRAQIVKGAVK